MNNLYDLIASLSESNSSKQTIVEFASFSGDVWHSAGWNASQNDANEGCMHLSQDFANLLLDAGSACLKAHNYFVHDASLLMAPHCAVDEADDAAQV